MFNENLRFETMLYKSSKLLNTSAITNKFRRLLESLFEVHLVGDNGVGKTSLIRKYFHGKFDENYTKTVRTEYDVNW